MKSRFLSRERILPHATLFASIALLALRLTLGWGLMEAGMGKIHKLQGTCTSDPLPECEGDECAAKRVEACKTQGEGAIAWFGSLTLFGHDGWTLPGGGKANFTAAAFNETTFGGAIILGLGTRLVAIPLMATMGVAMVTAHWDTIGLSLGFVSEIAFVYLMMAFSLLALGGGRFSLDTLIVRALKKQQ